MVTLIYTAMSPNDIHQLYDLQARRSMHVDMTGASMACLWKDCSELGRVDITYKPSF
jgi:hypothetical protein